MSTQYSVVNTRITEEVAEFQKKVSAIRAECLRMMREASVSADLQEIKEDLIDKLSDRALSSSVRNIASAKHAHIKISRRI